MPRFTIFLAVQVIAVALIAGCATALVITGHTVYAAILTLVGLGALLVAPSIMRRPR
jgi:hypothetical protein